MIVVDSSVWIDYFNGRSTPGTQVLRALINKPHARNALLVGDLILCEVLQGASSDIEFTRIKVALRAFRVTSMLNPDLAMLAASHFRALRAVGFTVAGVADLAIATFCIAEKHWLLHGDRHFDPMHTYLDLKVVPTQWVVNEPAARYGVELAVRA